MPLLGLVPFAAYLLVFLGGPLYFVISGALSDPDGRPTLANVVAALTEPQYHAAFAGSLLISAITAVVGAVFGTFLAQAVATARPGSPLRRIVSTASGVLAYFGGVPLAFAFIAALGQTGIATLWLRAVGLDLYAAGFRIDSLTGLGLTYVYFQVPLMVILVTPALEGLLPAVAGGGGEPGGVGVAVLAARRVAGAGPAPSRAPLWCCSATPSPPTPPRWRSPAARSRSCPRRSRRRCRATCSPGGRTSGWRWG